MCRIEKGGRDYFGFNVDVNDELDDKPEEGVRCPQCGESFANKRLMLTHLLRAPLGHHRDIVISKEDV